MSGSLPCRARLLAYSWFRTKCLGASHQAAWRFCRRHWPAFLVRAREERQPRTAPEDAPVRLVC
jgi:hypothetical protein